MERSRNSLSTSGVDSNNIAAKGSHEAATFPFPQVLAGTRVRGGKTSNHATLRKDSFDARSWSTIEIKREKRCSSPELPTCRPAHELRGGKTPNHATLRKDSFDARSCSTIETKREKRCSLRELLSLSNVGPVEVLDLLAVGTCWVSPRYVSGVECIAPPWRNGDPPSRLLLFNWAALADMAGGGTREACDS